LESARFRTIMLSRLPRSNAAARGLWVRAKSTAVSSVQEAVPLHKLEAALGDTQEAARERKARIFGDAPGIPVEGSDFDSKAFYDQVYGTNCEQVVGFLTIPIGAIGPLVINGKEFQVPLATTEGALVASANRGARAIREAGGATSRVLRDGMTRSPVLSFPSIVEASEFASWVSDPSRMEQLSEWFSTTTNFGQLRAVTPTVAGRYVYLRFEASTGDAMGMNMVGKGVNVVMEELLKVHSSATLVSLSSNMCTDKKPSAMNWVKGRGKSVVCEVVLSKEIVRNVLKTEIDALVQLNITKNLVGSALAGSIGGNNAHASNLVSAIYLATGQDPAQNVESSNCLVLMEPRNNGEELYVAVTMPSIEVGTVGGGTSLPVQRECLSQLGVAGAHSSTPGANARQLAEVVAATVLAGELSLNAALTSNHLISAHMELNRK